MISTHFEGVEEKNVAMAYVFIPVTYSWLSKAALS